MGIYIKFRFMHCTCARRVSRDTNINCQNLYPEAGSTGVVVGVYRWAVGWQNQKSEFFLIFFFEFYFFGRGREPDLGRMGIFILFLVFFSFFW